MTDENAKKLYKHFKGLIAGKLKTGNAVHDELIVSDATLNLAELVKKRPNIDFTEPADDKEPVQAKPQVPKDKSKEKK